MTLLIGFFKDGLNLCTGAIPWLTPMFPHEATAINQVSIAAQLQGFEKNPPPALFL
jgi:hypothetical protein